MDKRSIYGELAELYDVIYTWKDYDAEARKLEKLIRKFKRSKGKQLLECACGTGKHAQALARRFDVTATDINDGMLGVARRKVKGVKFLKSDMSRLNLGCPFDVIVCLFSSIGYLKTYARLKSAIDGFARHLVPGGVVIIEPWFTRKAFHAGKPSAGVFGDEDLRIARVTVSEVRGLLSVMDMHYLIAHHGKPVKHIVDRHELAMFEPAKILGLMRRAGLKAHFEKDGLMQDRGLYIGVREPSKPAR